VALKVFAGRLEGQAMPAMLSALDFALDHPLEVVLVAPPG
jgi:hypothetical protein